MLSDASTLGIFFIFTSASQFDVVLIMEGSNDVNAMDKDLAVEGPAIANLQQMVNDAKSRGQRVLLATIPPMNAAVALNGRNQGARLVPEFNDRIRGVAAAENVPLVDVYTAVNADVNRFVGTADGLHLTPDGYARVASTFLTAIQQNLEQPATATSLVRAMNRR
jgi:lysophospholipase L1-like esterase